MDSKWSRLEPVFSVPGQGFEPRFGGPEPPVLPLDDPGISFSIVYPLTSFEERFSLWTT